MSQPAISMASNDGNKEILVQTSVSKEKKKDLMSVISNLKNGAPARIGSLTSPIIKDSLPATTKIKVLDSSFPTSNNQDATTSEPSESANLNENIQPVHDSEGGDVMSNILHLLYQAVSKTPSDADVIPTENDETILQMQHAPEGGISAFKQLMTSFANGTDAVRQILSSEINFLYECRRCRGIFRSLPNLIKHKTQFCTNSGLMSSVLNRAANSSKEEDAAFKKILDILHPPEPEAEIVSFDEPVRQPQLRFDRDPIISVPVTLHRNNNPSIKLIERNQLTTNVSSTSSSSNFTPNKSAAGHNAKPSNFGRFFVGRPTKPIIPDPTKPYSCPVCKKQFVEKKSVRRHLISIHSLNLADAYKAMNSVEKRVIPPVVPISMASPDSTFRRTRSRRSEPSENLLKQCVEEITLGPSRKIHVLPQEFMLSSVQCPVCHQGLCRRTNVRRHLLEAHNLIIKGEKKYFQLKDIARNSKASNSPTLRRLRHLFTVSNRNPSPSENKRKSSPSNNQTSTDDVKSSKLNDTSNSNASIVSASDDVANAYTNKEKETEAVSLDNVQFVQSKEGTNNASADVANDQSKTSLYTISINDSQGENDADVISELAEDFLLSETDRKFSHDVPVSSTESHDDDTPDDEPPPKKLRQLAPMVNKPAGRVNGKIVMTSAQVMARSSSRSGATTMQLASNTGKSITRNGNPAKHLIIRRVSSDNIQGTGTTSSNGRTLIKVELRNSSKTNEAHNNTNATPPKTGAKYDIGALVCFTCEEKFQTRQAMRRHMINIHSFTTEDALATCYDTSTVDSQAQITGLKHGFDIANAKCLLCKRFYFSREALLKHLVRNHHKEPDILKDLRLACSLEPEESDSKQIPDSKPLIEHVKTESTATENSSSSSKLSLLQTIVKKCTEEQAAEALKFFPKDNVNVAALRCMKCRQRCPKTWDLKVHVLKHLNLGFYICKFCKNSDRMASSRASDMIKHFQEAHGRYVRTRDPALQDCRVNFQHLWEAYGIPLGKTP